MQVLAESFWKRWKAEYLELRQPRTKWPLPDTNIIPDQIVVLKDKDSCRLDWPVGMIDRVFPSDDDLVRKVEVAIMKNGKRQTYIRPVTEIIPLLPEEEAD